MKLFLEKFIRPKPKKAGSSLLEETETARLEWRNAVKELDQIKDEYMLEHVIHKIKAAERRFIALLQQAQSEGLMAWPEHLEPPRPNMQEEEPAKAGAAEKVIQINKESLANQGTGIYPEWP